MLLFLMMALMLVLLALSMVLPGLLRKDHGLNRDMVMRRDALNLAVLREQLRELDADLYAGTIDANGYQSARHDLERSMAEERGDRSQFPSVSPAQRGTALVLALLILLAAMALYAGLGSPEALSSTQVLSRKEDTPAVSGEQIEGMVKRLVEKLKVNPDDASGWRMLAHSYETLGRFDQAVDAYRHLMQLIPDNPDFLTDYAVTLGMSLNQRLAGEPEKLIDHALAIDPNHIQALALSGSAAFERKDYPRAIKNWERILALAPNDAGMTASIKESIANAKRLSGM